MIPVKKLYSEIERAELCAVRIFDKFGNKIHEYEGTSATDLVEHLKEIHAMYKYYGVCEMWCCTDKQATANFRSAFKWKVTFSDKDEVTPAETKTGSMAGQMKETLEMMMMMKSVFGNNNNENNPALQKELMDQKFATFKAEQNIELKKLEMAKEDPMNQYGWLAPLVLSGMGKKPEEIKEMMSLVAMSKVAGIPGNNGSAVAGVKNENTTFEEMQGWTNDQKNAKIMELEEKMYKVVSAEQFILLLQIILEKPERVAKALEAAKQGLI